MVRLKTFPLISASIKRLAVLLALLSLACSVYVFGPSIRARYLFHEMESVQLSHTTFEGAQRLARKLGAKPYGSCDRAYCAWTADVNDARLPRWWRGSGVTFAIDFEVKDSLVASKGAWYVIGTDPYNNFSPFDQVSIGMKEKWIQTRGSERVIPELPTGAGWKVNYFEKNGSRKVADAMFVVRMTPRSSAEDWRRYTAFDYSCLWKYKGCKSARELLPIADSFPAELANGVSPRQ
jgi:hypothetical protein